VKFNGGTGATGGAAAGGGGGGSGGSAANGNNGAVSAGATAVTGGGNGGAGGVNAAGSAPTTPPGGGGGGADSNGSAVAGGAGSPGQIKITYINPTVVTLTSGTSWTVPEGVTNVTVEAWGGGGGGGGDASTGNNGAGGGGGGAFSRGNSIAVTSGNIIPISIGPAGTAGSTGGGNGGTGGNTTFGTAVVAVGGAGGIGGNSGAGGAGGLASSSTGDVKFDGGAGATGAGVGGGGGGSGGTGSNGNAAGLPNAAAVAVTGGGIGGVGGSAGAGAAPVSGPGGGGGGADAGGSAPLGGAGFAGQLRITYQLVGQSSGVQSVSANGSTLTSPTGYTQGGTTSVPTFTLAGAINAGSYWEVVMNVRVPANSTPGAVFDLFEVLDAGTVAVGDVPEARLVVGCASLSGTVAKHADGDGHAETPLANNPTFPGTEDPVAGVAVTLTYAGADDTFGTADDETQGTTTDAYGNYTFTSLLAGSYQVSITPPTGTTALADADSNSGNSFAGSITTIGSVTPITLAADEDKIDQDFELTALNRIGNRVWADIGGGGGVANNGIQDGTEAGISGVTVEIYAANAAGYATGSALQTTTTDANGYYGFYVTPGDYVVKIPASNFTGGGALVGKYSSGTGPTVCCNGVDPDVDPTDKDDNGFNALIPSSTGVVSAAVTLTSQGEPLGETDLGPNDSAASDSDANLTVDFGFSTAAPTAVKLSYVKGWWQDGKVTVEWETLSELNTLGFDLYRLSGGLRIQVNQALVPALNADKGGVYRTSETMERPLVPTQYVLVETETTGKQIEYGPFVVPVAPSARVSAIRKVAGQLELQFTGESTTDYVIETTDDVVNGHWETVGKFRSDQVGNLLYHPPLDGTDSARFYRALRP
jgi:hypothetical protein